MYRNRIWMSFRLLLALALLLTACVAAPPAAPTAAPTSPPPPKVVEQTVIVQPTVKVVVATTRPTHTPTTTSTPRPTRTPDVRPTQQYEAMKAKVEKYAKDGLLYSPQGTYHRLKDYSFDWAKIGYYVWQKTGFQPVDFVIETDIDWASASDSANTFDSGCGFAFHANGKADHYAIFLTMDGYVDSIAYYKDNWSHLGQGWYGKVDFPKGKAHIALVVSHEKYYFFVNDQLVKRYTGFQGKLVDGDLGYVVTSGTNLDFGTSCKFTNTDLWVVQ